MMKIATAKEKPQLQDVHRPVHFACHRCTVDAEGEQIAPEWSSQSPWRRCCSENISASLAV
ncbi:hypothetical protein ACLBOM_32545 [Escherichia coli]